MPAENLGEPLTGVYSISGGQAQLFERGLTVNGPASGAIVSFAFPMIGRPSIATGTTMPIAPFGPDAITFSFGDEPLAPVVSLIQNALANRLSLVPTGQTTARVPVTIGPETILRPVERPGAGGIVIPGLCGMRTSVAPQNRQLYDVAIRGDRGWRIVAPHAVYHRQTWTDFGIASISDTHVARRIDRFRELLVQSGRIEAARGMFNFNDRFRGFVKYANYLHSIGVLDVILAIGDVIDYIFEGDDDPAGGGNNEFMRKLILGQAPGPDFPVVEELRVPIFMVPGNHDYRVHPYRLIFDVRIRIDGFPKDLTRVKNFPPYHLLQSDALVLDNVLAGRPADEDVKNLSPESAAHMVRVDPTIEGFRRFLSDRRSYVVSLGKHHIAMLDSSHDVGIVTDVIGGLVALIGKQDEDKVTFLGANPNSEGVSENELAMVSRTIDQAPDDGLIIVGIHAPLFNPWKEEYPYFLRQTQRAAQSGQDVALVARLDATPIRADLSIEEQVKGRHPLWFPGERDQRAPTFVKRGDSQDLLDFGISRGRADDLMKALAGIGSRRRADVVLSGHTHNQNEFSVQKTHTGELAYSMDFYTQNPFRYYPARFTRSWQEIPGIPPRPATVEPETAVTSVEIAPGAAADVTPWPVPYDTSVEHQIQIPPYPNPLNGAADPRAWWAEHRPLVLQTGAYGPLKVLDDFAGFRVLQVKNDIIDKIHFVPTGRLEENNYQLAWEDAIRIQPLRQYRYVERSRPLGAPRASEGALAGIVFPALGATTVVVYRDEEDRLRELRQRGTESRTSNLTDLARTNRAKGSPTLFIEGTGGSFVALYRGTDDHVYGLHWSTEEVGGDSLSLTAGAPPSNGNPIGFVQLDGANLVVYRARADNLQALVWRGVDLPVTENITPADAPPAAGDPAAFVNTNTGHNIIVYRGDDRHIHSIYWAGIDPVAHDNLSAVAESPTAAGDPAGYYTRHNDEHQVIYRADDRHIHELWWRGIEPVRQWDVTASAGAPPAASDPIAYYSAGTNTKHYIYRGIDDHLHEIWVIPGGAPTHVDMTLEARAPLATGKPTAFVVAGQETHHAMFRGKDGQVHEIRWTSNAQRIAPRIGVQSDWRWCNKCQGLFYGPQYAGSVCPAGGTHAPAFQSGSSDYSLSDDATTPGVQSEWRWCNRCTGLFYGPQYSASRCPAGGTHASPAQSGSANYCLPHGAAAPGRQGDWRWCNKCQGLFYGPNVSLSRCPAGGAHAAPDQTGSANYGLGVNVATGGTVVWSGR